MGEKRRCGEGVSQKGKVKKGTTCEAWREDKPMSAQRREGDSPALPQHSCPPSTPVIGMAMHQS